MFHGSNSNRQFLWKRSVSEKLPALVWNIFVFLMVAETMTLHRWLYWIVRNHLWRVGRRSIPEKSVGYSKSFLLWPGQVLYGHATAETLKHRFQFNYIANKTWYSEWIKWTYHMNEEKDKTPKRANEVEIGDQEFVQNEIASACQSALKGRRSNKSIKLRWTTTSLTELNQSGI